jgi:hypothetical protein
MNGRDLASRWNRMDNEMVDAWAKRERWRGGLWNKRNWLVGFCFIRVYDMICLQLSIFPNKKDLSGDLLSNHKLERLISKKRTIHCFPNHAICKNWESKKQLRIYFSQNQTAHTVFCFVNNYHEIVQHVTQLSTQFGSHRTFCAQFSHHKMLVINPTYPWCF